MTAAIAFLCEHWKLAALAGVCAACFAAGRLSVRPPPPAEHLQEESHKAAVSVEESGMHKVEAPTKTTTRKYAPVVCPQSEPETQFYRPNGLAPPPSDLFRIVEETVVERGQIVTDTATAKAEEKREDRHLDLTIAPAPPSGWALQLGVEDALSSRTVRIAARRRLFSGLWVELSAVPARRSIGVAAAIEF